MTNTPHRSTPGVFQTEGAPKAASRPALFARKRSLALSTVLGLALVMPLAGPSFINPVQTADAAEAVVPDSFVAPTGFEDLVEAVMPAVVAVQVQAPEQVETSSNEIDRLPDGTPFDRFFRRFGPDAEEFFRRGPGGGQTPNPRRGGGQGSGFFISQDGYLVTNNHVIEGGGNVQVVMANGDTLDAQVLGTDSRTDLALLKVEGEDFTYVRLAEEQPRIGEVVLAIGNPFGLGGSVTSGIVSQQGRDIRSGPYDEFLQIDAAINRGNSGGPTFNMRGEVVGVNTAIFSPSGGNVGIAFAVPSTVTADVVGDLIETGAVARGWLGVNIQTITPELAEGLGRDSTDGAIVVSAAAGSPAEAAGLVSGDTILAVNDEAVDSPSELARLIGSYDPDESVELTVWRDGREESVDVLLGTLPSERELASQFRPSEPIQVQPSLVDQLGMTVAPSASVGLDTPGLAVTEINPEGVAAQRELREGDVIVEVDGTPVASLRDLNSALSAAGENGKDAALVRVQGQNGASRFVALPTGQDRG